LCILILQQNHLHKCKHRTYTHTPGVRAHRTERAITYTNSKRDSDARNSQSHVIPGHVMQQI
jgi:hypothetical protein